MKIDKVTITGADDTTDIDQLVKWSAEYPFVEWGILVSRSGEGSRRFPRATWFSELAAAAKENEGMKLSCHVCGYWVHQICGGDWAELIAYHPHITACQRVQLNFHAMVHKLKDAFFLSALRETIDHGWQLIMQVDGVNDYLVSRAFDDGINAVPLYDLSGGKGQVPDEWPGQMAGIYSGYAGGLGPDNLKTELERINQVATPNGTIWIDMETKVRDYQDRYLDDVAVESVLAFMAEHSNYLST